MQRKAPGNLFFVLLNLLLQLLNPAQAILLTLLIALSLVKDISCPFLGACNALVCLLSLPLELHQAIAQLCNIALNFFPLPLFLLQLCLLQQGTRRIRCHALHLPENQKIR